MFKTDKYKWMCDQIHDGTLLRVSSTAGYDIDIQSLTFEDGKIIVNGQFDVTDIWIYGFNSQYHTMDNRYPQWADRNYYYQDTKNEWRALKNG